MDRIQKVWITVSSRISKENHGEATENTLCPVGKHLMLIWRYILSLQQRWDNILTLFTLFLKELLMVCLAAVMQVLIWGQCGWNISMMVTWDNPKLYSCHRQCSWNFPFNLWNNTSYIDMYDLVFSIFHQNLELNGKWQLITNNLDISYL